MENKSTIIMFLIAVLLLGLGITAICVSCKKNNEIPIPSLMLEGGDISC